LLSDEEREASERETLGVMQRLATGTGPKAAAYKKALALLELAAGVADTETLVDKDSGDDQGGLQLEELKTSGDD